MVRKQNIQIENLWYRHKITLELLIVCIRSFIDT